MSILVSAGIESIFFLVAGTVLCFGFEMTMLVTPLLVVAEQCLYPVKDFSASDAALPVSSLP